MSSSEIKDLIAAMNKIGDAIESVALGLERLGTNNAMTGMGAIELLAKEVHDGVDEIVSMLKQGV